VLMPSEPGLSSAILRREFDAFAPTVNARRRATGIIPQYRWTIASALSV
jgi:hypothetical protein